MVDAKIAARLRQQAILGVVAHMYVTCRFVYSWPMDQARLLSGSGDSAVYQKVDKEPNYAIWSLHPQPWHTAGQRAILTPYKIGFFVVAAITIYIWALSPLIKTVKKLFCYQVGSVGKAQGLPFSSVTNIKVYVPVIRNLDEQFVCCHCDGVLPQHRPALIKYSPEDK